MNDQQLKHDTLVALVVIMILGMAYFAITSESVEHRNFIEDCSDTYSQQHCEELWEMGNG